MNTMNTIFKTLLFTSLTLLVSCSDEPYEGPIPSPNSPSVTGIQNTYILTAVNTSVATDLNGNGTPSTNQMNETACFNNNIITLKTDGTFTADQNGVEINEAVTPNTIVCFTDPDITGTWVITGANLTLTYNDGPISLTDTYVVDATSIKIVFPDEDIVSKDGTGNAVYVNADVQLVYTKQ